MICANFGCNWPILSEEEIDMQMFNTQTDGRTMDDQESSPTELKVSTILSRIPYLRKLFQL
jgi:hypothetical protein